MLLTLTHEGRTTLNATAEDALELGYPAAIIGAAVKAAAQSEVTRTAEKYRAMLAMQSAGKLDEHRIKEEIASDPDAASAAELDLLEREATARGTDRDGLIVQIAAKAVADRQTALLIGVIEAETNAAIMAIPDDADDIETLVADVLAAAKAEAETEAQAALASASGG